MSEKKYSIPFHHSFFSGNEKAYLTRVLESGETGSGGPFSRRCEEWLTGYSGAEAVLLTNSCTSALELAAVLGDIGPGDEVIMPSFTFTSTANAFVLRGAVPVFVDIRGDNLNIDESLIEQAITERTRAIVPVHYAGMACEMATIMRLAEQYGLLVIEDAAQALMARYRDRPLGTIGHLGTLSFHMSKSLGCGEGGALLVNRPEYVERARILHDKGTNRAEFRAGKVRQYTWVDLGLSAPPSELQTAVLLAQLESADEATRRRIMGWEAYQSALRPLCRTGALNCPAPQPWQQHNGHIYPLLFDANRRRDRAREELTSRGIETALHYQPLHQTPAGQRFGRPAGVLRQAESLPARLLRLPVWPGLPETVPEEVAQRLAAVLNS